MAAAVGRVLRLGGRWSAVTPGGPLPQTLRLISTTTAVRRKNVGASGPEKYTEAFIKKQIEEFNLGKRHLANMMGEDPETFTQEDIDRAIAYLFPSGLFDKQARPMMKHPTEIFPEQRKIQWGEDGRPFHFLFYTGKQSYYSLMHYSRFIQLLQKLLTLPCGDIEEKYIQKFSKEVPAQLKKVVIEPLKYDERGVAFSTGEGTRKTARATAVVYDNGTGKITVNGIDILHYFPVLQDREQLLFPFQFLDRIGKHDMVCTVSGGGRSAQAGAIRLASAKALRSFVTEQEVEFMRQAGLLTVDPRVKERKKPGQEGARRKFTWKKR
ncbi:small ribosomal subunit protein uS9m isoform 3-T3 [Chlamydotis macqueenii]